MRGLLHNPQGDGIYDDAVAREAEMGLPRKHSTMPCAFGLRIGFDSLRRLDMLCAPIPEDELLWQN